MKNTNTVWNLGNPINLFAYGPTNSFVATAWTNNLSIGHDWTLSGYALRLSTNLDLAGNLTVTNGMLELYYGWQTNVRSGGSVIIATNGSISHGCNGASAVYRLAMQVEGDLTVADGGAIDVDGKGYSAGTGPGAGSSANSNYRAGASHGGLGAEWTSPFATWVTYGSFMTPTNLGSAAYGMGGGAVEVQVNGTTALSGSMTAKGTASTLAGNAGGSLFLRTGFLLGNGVLDASAGSASQYGGGGGRIAVILTGSSSFGSVTNLRAFGAGSRRGAAGTIYQETASQGAGHGTVVVSGDAATYTTNTVTCLPPSSDITAEAIDSLKFATLTATNYANVALAASLSMGDLFLQDDRVRLRLRGNTLSLKAPYHDNWGSATRVVYDEGRIVWATRGTFIIIR